MGYIKIEMQRRNSQYKNHVHEVQGYLKVDEDGHYHRFSFVTGEAVFNEKGEHYHDIIFKTDNAQGHFHEFKGRTLGILPAGDRHVHYLEGSTTEKNAHSHNFRLITLLDNPTEV